MYFADTKRHNRPHIHVKFQDEEAVYGIPEGDLLEGSIPPGKARLVAAWIELHKEEPLQMEINIIDLAESHIPQCNQLWLAAGMAHEAEIEKRVAKLLQLNPGLSKIALDQAGQIVGCVLGSYNGFSGYVFRLVVRESKQRHGIGSRLIEACEQAFKRAGAAKVMFVCEESLVQWYKKRGYEVTNSRFLYKIL